MKIHYLITDVESGARLTRASSVRVAMRWDTPKTQLASPATLAHAVREVPA